jgi:hypothetical protein
MGATSYSENDCLNLLGTPSGGNASLILAKQLIAAIENGGTTDPNVSAVVAEAQVWMSANGNTLPYAIKTSTTVGAEAVNLAALLDSYNNGNGGTPHCN